jgi:hypothetical protein
MSTLTPIANRAIYSISESFTFIANLPVLKVCETLLGHHEFIE